MSFTSALAQSLSQARTSRTVTRFAILGFIAMVMLSAGTMPVAADLDPGSAGGSDFICDGDLGDILGNFMLIITVVGMTAAAVVAAVNQMAASAKPDGKYEENRNKALIGMVAVPVIVYLSPVLIDALTGLNLGCLSP